MIGSVWICPRGCVICREQQACRNGRATEASIWSNYFGVDLPLPKHWTSIPYGHALSKQFYRIVDRKGRDCPEWVAGELWIGGAGVALGYRGDPELTAERFVIWNGSRWFRTGDLGRYWPEHIIEFLGRKDFQVKIRGHRIELGEIETALKEHPGVRDAVVTVTEQQGTKRLTGYIVPETEGESVLMESQAVDAEQAEALWADATEAVKGGLIGALRQGFPRVISCFSGSKWSG